MKREEKPPAWVSTDSCSDPIYSSTIRPFFRGTVNSPFRFLYSSCKSNIKTKMIQIYRKNTHTTRTFSAHPTSALTPKKGPFKQLHVQRPHSPVWIKIARGQRRCGQRREWRVSRVQARRDQFQHGRFSSVPHTQEDTT